MLFDGGALTEVGRKRLITHIVAYVATWLTVFLPLLDLVALFKTVLVMGYFGLCIFLAWGVGIVTRDTCTSDYYCWGEKILFFFLSLAMWLLVGVLFLLGLLGAFPAIRPYF